MTVKDGSRRTITLVENCQAKDLLARIAKVAVVSFNYDRCFEHYLHQAVQNYYAMSADEAGRIVGQLEVHHPYGKVGSLPWISKPGAIEYGANPTSRQLIEIAKQLRTFTEGTDPSASDIESIRAAVAGADRLLFLGFAFHPLNLDLLYPTLAPRSAPAKAPRVFATAYGLSKSDARLIGADLCKKTGQTEAGIEIRTDLKCADLLREYTRSLSLI